MLMSKLSYDPNAPVAGIWPVSTGDTFTDTSGTAWTICEKGGCKKKRTRNAAGTGFDLEAIATASPGCSGTNCNCVLFQVKEFTDAAGVFTQQFIFKATAPNKAPQNPNNTYMARCVS